MNILFVWTGLTSYMGDCWRELSKRQDLNLRVIVDDSGGAAHSVSLIASEVLRGLTYELNGTGLLHDWRPDVIFAVGWHSALCRSIVCDRRFADIPKVCCFDMPWRWKLRCLAAPLVLGRFLRHYHAAFVPGKVCSRYARWLGFRKIYTGLFGIDTSRFIASRSATRNSQPAYFLYIGRNSSEKRLDDLRAAHRLYQRKGGTLPLKLYGKGLEGGFVNPNDVPELMRNAAAFVLASDFDPWPLVLLEAMSSGCPVIASDRCTNSPELGRNWKVFPVGDINALARIMLDFEADEGKRNLSAEVTENIELARQYDCREWTARVLTIVRELKS